MDTKTKNKPPSFVIIAIAILVLALFSYFILLMFFPTLFHDVLTGEQPPIIK